MHSCKAHALILTAAACCTSALAQAQTYPTKPIRMVVAWGPGGAPDIFARLIGQKLHEQMGQPVIVDNRPGATGNIGAEIVAKSPSDGHTLFNATLSLAVSPAFYKDLPFDPIKSFAPVTMLASVPLVLVVNPALPVRSVAEMISHAKANPGKLNYASVGNGSPAHVTAELLQVIGGIKVVHIPYKSGGAMATAMLASEAQLGFPAIAPALPHIKSNRLRPIAVTATRRADVLPDVPTFAEEHLEGMEADNWNAILAPAGTPRRIIDRLQSEIAKAARATAVAERFTQQGAAVNVTSPEALAKLIRADVDKWSKVVKAAGIKRQ